VARVSACRCELQFAVLFSPQIRLPGRWYRPRPDPLQPAQRFQASQQAGLRSRIVLLPRRAYDAPVNLLPDSTAQSHHPPPAPGQPDPLRTPIRACHSFYNSKADQFRDGLRRRLLRNSHAFGQLCDGALRVNQVLDQVTMALTNSRESRLQHTLHHQFIDSQSKKESEVRQVQLRRDDTPCLHNYGCVLYPSRRCSSKSCFPGAS
jgi:hypothetical protein